jgi:3-phenylpropionate/cinnamic acid dioxygenase small subunit
MTEVEDRLAIVALTTTYARAVDTKDWDLYESVFAPDAVIDYTSSGGLRGSPSEARRWLEEVLAPFTMTQHLVTNHDISVDDESATCHTDFYNPMGLDDGAGGTKVFFVGGSYSDKLRRTDGRWLITERVEHMLWSEGLNPRP